VQETDPIFERAPQWPVGGPSNTNRPSPKSALRLGEQSATAMRTSGGSAWFLRAAYGYAARMVALIVALLLVWLAVLVVGLVVKGLFWLFVVGAILFVATAIVGWVRRRV
jgi:hypothetical protein